MLSNFITEVFCAVQPRRLWVFNFADAGVQSRRLYCSICCAVFSYTIEGFIERQFKFGTIVLKTNLDKTPQEIYFLYKERSQIEQSFDFLKNLLEQDKCYMQNEKSLETWAFINHLALMLNYKIYNLLRMHNLLSKYSVSDFIYHLKYVFKVKADSQWLTTEISAKTSKLLSALGLHIT